MVYDFPEMTVSASHLMIGGEDALELAKTFGTPLYAVNESVLRANMRGFTRSLAAYSGKSKVYYASKALSVKAVLHIAAEEGLGADVVSSGELLTALAGGMPKEDIMYHGNNKTTDELILALEKRIGHIVVDRKEDVERLIVLSKQYGFCPKLLFRIVPGIDAHTHAYIKTGQFDSKFGLPIEEALPLMQYAFQNGLPVTGLHCHIGSQIFDFIPFQDAAALMLSFLKKAQTQIDPSIDELDLGGGFGIRYTDEDTPIPASLFTEKTIETVITTCQHLAMPLPTLFFEPGRAIAATAGSTLYTVGGTKTTKTGKTYVFVDGGMSDNPRHALYGAQYEAVIADRADAPCDKTVTVAGKLCESGDVIAEAIPLQDAKEGDILVTFSTGAYCFSMASHYNRLPGAAMVLVGQNAPRLIVRRETPEEMHRLDL